MDEQFDSERYWEQRYLSGNDSGEGSYGELARYKAEFLNNFIQENNITTVLELGCGDGAQLDLAKYPQYIGVDISSTALQICREAFSNDYTKCFIEYDLLWDNPLQDLAISLDVLFLLVEDNVFHSYMMDLFKISNRYVIIYSSNYNQKKTAAPHVRHYSLTDWVDTYMKRWKCIFADTNAPQHITEKTFSKFYIFEKQ